MYVIEFYGNNKIHRQGSFKKRVERFINNLKDSAVSSGFHPDVD